MLPKWTHMRLDCLRISLRYRNSHFPILPFSLYVHINILYFLPVYNDLYSDRERLEKNYLHAVDLNRCRHNFVIQSRTMGNAGSHHKNSKEEETTFSKDAAVFQNSFFRYKK